ncbi:MAG: sugar phosphate isomerase/epimerase family protein [Candidatus Helarchaeota archaeon]
MSYKLIDLRYQMRTYSPEELLKHLETFHLTPKFSVGIWYFTPGGGRFHERYVPEKSISERLEMAKQLADLGVTGIEAHYPAEINLENIDLWKDLKRSGIRVVGIAFSHFYEKIFEFGSLSNPNSAVRKVAIDIAIEALRLVKELGADFCISWPGIDGYTYPLGTFYQWMWDTFEEAMAEALDTVPGVRIALEPKPYEPAPNNIYRTTAEGILMAQRVEAKLQHPQNIQLLKKGHCLVGLNPEIGHVRMGFEPLAAAFTLIGKYGKLVHSHWNSQPLGNYDQDLNVGVVGIEETLALLYALKVLGYKEYFGIDINPERMPVETAVQINIEVITKLIEIVESLPHEEIIQCYLHPEDHRGRIEKIMLNYLYK